MPHVTALDRQWQQLMALCENESKLREDGGHPRLLRHVSSEIDRLAGEMGFKPRQIVDREFRAHRKGDHILAIIAD